MNIFTSAFFETHNFVICIKYNRTIMVYIILKKKFAITKKIIFFDKKLLEKNVLTYH